MQALDFSKRSIADEWMDSETVSFDVFRACLRDLARVNTLTMASRPTLDFFDRLLARFGKRDRPIEIVDVGSGYGDGLRSIHAWAEQRGVEVSLTGVDLNPWSRLAAAEVTPPVQGITWVTENVFDYKPPRAVDVIVSSLFTHHLSDLQVTKFLGWMEETAQLGWFVNDLHRSYLPYQFFRHFSKWARFHPFVQHDGPVSIARAFTSADWDRLITEARIPRGGVSVKWRMPFRITLTRLKAP